MQKLEDPAQSLTEVDGRQPGSGQDTTPNVLYKYRHSNERTIQLLCSDLVYFADPSTFNDPLDTNPCVDADSNIDTMERTVSEMVRRRVRDEMQAGARAVKYRGPKTMMHIEKHSHAAAEQVIERLRYNSTDPEYKNASEALSFQLAGFIEGELLRQYDKGILSLARRYDCPLMWSHYGDQHRGLCIGYSIPPGARLQLHAVRYGGDRTVLTSTVAAMVLDHNKDAGLAVDNAVLLRKAPDWRYEQEWRLLGTRGEQDSPLEMTEVIFGMRCPETVIHTVTSALNGREKPVTFYRMQEVHGTFGLMRVDVDLDELAAYYPRRALDVYEAFEDETRG